VLATIGKVFVKLIGGSRNDRIVRARMAVVRDRVNAVERELREEYRGLVRAAAGEGDDPAAMVEAAEAWQLAPVAAKDWLRSKTDGLRRRLAAGETEQDILPEAFAAIRVASWLAQNHRQFDVQLVAGQVLHQGCIAEEATGEGKTIACYPAVYLAVLAGLKVHVVTVNDYLVQRDRDFAAPIFDLLGVTVGAIQQPMSAAARHPQYACNVIYGTNSEFGFDYLRDNMKLSVAEQVLHDRQDYAIIDEVDEILIDEARTPLIISGPAYGDVARYRKADTVAREIIKRHRPYDRVNRRVESLKRTVKALQADADKAKGDAREKARRKLASAEDELAAAESELAGLEKFYEVELDKKSCHPTGEGIAAAQELAGVGSFYVGANMEWPHLLEQSLKAHVVYERDKDYVVRGGEVIIVDEFTGREMEGRQWSDGLHQAVEAKERVPVQEETQTIGTITYQNLFRLYGRLAGMTGTAMTEAEEFMKIYKMDVVSVPTHRPVNRIDHEDRIYREVPEKYDALVEEINDYSKRGRPVLVGTTSIEKSEYLSDLLVRRYGIEHEVLNARPENAAREAEIVMLAGQQRPLKAKSRRMVGNVTIATNMAGRGTDIRLGPGVVWKNCRVPSAAEHAELGVPVSELYPPGVNKCCIHCQDYDPATNCAHCFKPKIDPDFPRRGRTECREEVPCGLHIVGTERHEARRVDNQLRGRSGRQGDPGSSRFFLSLRDDLMAVFAGEWTIKVLGWLGLEEGMAIEDKRVSKGIARAQKKVEQRNFDIRKSLLEYDEVMDHQRKYFYGLRQGVLDGSGVQTQIRRMLDETISDAVKDYLDGEYAHRCIAEWARANLEVTVAPEQIVGDNVEELEIVERDLRARARDEAAQTISVTIGEYADTDIDRREWDLRGLSSWAMSRFRVQLSQNQLAKMDPPEMADALTEAAWAHIETVDLSPLAVYLEAGYAVRCLCEWLRNKFGVEVDPASLHADEPERVEETLREVVEGVYLRREIEYPPEYAIDITVAEAGTDNAYAVKALCDWANAKYDAGWTGEQVTGKDIEQVRKDLVALSEAFMTGGRLEETVDAYLAGGGASAEPQAVAAWAKDRFDTDLPVEQIESADRRKLLVKTGRDFLRRELTELERFVLLQIYDMSWKDHLLAMDHLRGAVGLRSYAEQDPKIAYKKEGFRLFEEMLSSIRTKVTDIVFRARMGAEMEATSVYQISNLVHEQMTAYDAMARDMAAQQAAAAPRKLEQIVRQTPKVGRNDPCPCGSGKKYKKCCGRVP